MQYMKLIAVVMGALALSSEAQLIPQPVLPVPSEPEVPPREMELVNWMGTPTGDDIAIMALDFQPSILPGVGSKRMSEIYSAVSNGNTDEHPAAQIIAAFQQGQVVEGAQLLKALQAEDDAASEIHFLAGLWAESKRGDGEKAIASYSRARELTEPEADKLLIDRYILGSAMLANPDQSELRQAGVAAALRLSDSFWNSGSATAGALRSMLVDLGDPEAAEKIAESAQDEGVAKSQNRSRGSNSNYGMVISAFAAGDRDGGLQMAVEGVKQGVQAFSQYGSLNNVSYRYRQMINFVAAFGLADHVLEAFETSESSSMDAKVQYAIACELLNQVDLALPEYRKILAADPNQHAARWRLIVNSVGDPIAQELLKDFPQEHLQQYGSTLSNLLQNEQDFNKRLEIVQLIHAFLISLEPDKSGSLSWVTNVLSPLVDDFYSDDVRVMSVYQTSGGYGFENEAQQKRSEQAAELRASLHRKFCEAMLRHPSLASAGFASISGFAGLPDCRTEEEFAALARSILASEFTPDESFYYNHPTSSSYLPSLTPAQFLFRQAVDGGSMTVIDEEVIPLLEKSNKSNLSASMKAFSRLYACEQDDYISVANAIVEEGVAGIPGDSLISYIQSAAQQRGIDADLGPLVLSVVRSIRDQSSSVPYSAVNYVTNVFNSSGPDAARSFINGVSEIYLGESEQQADFVAKHFKRGFRPGEPSGLAYAFKEFLERFRRPMGVTVLAMEKYIDCGYQSVADNDMANQFENSVRSYRFDDNYAATFVMLDQSPWLKPVAKFQIWPMKFLSSGSCYEHLIRQMKQSSSSIRKRMLDHIQSVTPETFGKNLTLACFESDPGRGTTRVLATHLPAIEELSHERQKELVSWYQTFLANEGRVMGSSSQARAVSKWIARVTAPPERAETTNDQPGVPPAAPPQPVIPLTVEGFLATETPAEASTSSLLHQHVLPILVAAAGDPDLCARVFAHYKKLAAMPQVVSSGGSSNEEANDSQLLAGFVSQVDPPRSASGASFAPLVAIFSSEAGQTLVPGEGLNSIIASTYAATRSDVSPGVRQLLEKKATLQNDAVAALLLAASAPYRHGGQTVYGMRLHGLADLAGSNGWARTEKVLKSTIGETFEDLVSLETGPVGLRLLVASAPPASSANASSLVDLALVALNQGGTLPGPLLWGLLENEILGREGSFNEDRKQSARKLMHGVVQSLPPGTSLTPDQFISLLEAAEKVGYSSRRVQLRFGMSFVRQPWFLALLVKHGQFAAARQHFKSQLLTMQLPRVPASGGAEALPTGRVISRSISSLPDGTRRVTEDYDSGQRVTFIEDSFGNRTLAGSQGGANSPVTFDDQLGAAIPEFVKTLPDPGLSLLAELILLATPDASSSDDDPEESGIRSRIIAALNRLPSEPVANPFIEERILSILGPVSEESEGLRKRIELYGKDVDVLALAMFEDDALKVPRERIFKAYLDNALVYAPDEFARIMVELLSSSKSNDYRVVRALQTYGSGFPDVLFRSSDGFNEARARRYITVFQQLLEVGGTNRQWSKRMDCLNGAIVCHVIAGEVDRFTEWFAGLDPSLQATFRGQLQLQRLLQLVSKPLSSSGLSEEAKVAALGALMEAKIFPPEADAVNAGPQPLQGGGDKLFKSLADDGVLPESAIITHGPRWAIMNPRFGAAWDEVAELQAKKGNSQEALESWIHAVMAVPWDNKKKYTDYHLKAAKLMLKMNRLEPALTWFEFFNRGRLHEEGELEFDTLFRETRYKVMMRQGRTHELISDAVTSLQTDSSDTSAWQQLGSVFDAIGRQKLSVGNARDAEPMLEFALLLLSKSSAENPALGTGQVNEIFEALMEARAQVGDMGDSVRLISKQSEWRYFYSKEAHRDWKQPIFDDTDWKVGKGQLGYGDDDETTVLDWGNNPDDKPITAYFRKTFMVDDLAAVELLAIDLVRDDGAIVYLNGKEVRRDNLPKGTIRFSTEALKSPKKSEENLYRRVTISPESLREGSNVIAVEVHQNDPDSSDLSFDLQLLTNVLSLEKTMEAIDVNALKELLEKDSDFPPLDASLWKIIDESRKPREVIMIEPGFRINSLDLGDGVDPFRNLSAPRRSGRRVVLPPSGR